jgi:catechol 2,3-dioxygenase-like lactoylglutathione lyase family enzyme
MRTKLSARSVASEVPQNQEGCRMKRFHIHVSVGDLAASVRFYSTLFGVQPARLEVDYAKWMLDDPRINFAISTHRQPVGVNHLGFQVDNDEELRAMHAQLTAADSYLVEESEQACCYARSDKYWVTDPAGIAWETFHTLGSIPVYGEDTAVFNHGSSTVPAQVSAPKAARCAPARAVESSSSCCSK